MKVETRLQMERDLRQAGLDATLWDDIRLRAWNKKLARFKQRGSGYGVNREVPEGEALKHKLQIISFRNPELYGVRRLTFKEYLDLEHLIQTGQVHCPHFIEA